MTDLYDERITAMKARERPLGIDLAWKERNAWVDLRNVERYVAHRLKSEARPSPTMASIMNWADTLGVQP